MSFRLLSPVGIIPKGSLIGMSVNMMGTAGTGLALSIREHQRSVFDQYVKACRRGTINTDTIVLDGLHQKLLLMPIKTGCVSHPSLEIIETSIKRLWLYMTENNIDTVYLPKLGCSEGPRSLDFDEDIIPLLTKYFLDTDFTIYIY